MTLVDYLVIAAYAVAMLAVGSYYSRRTQTADDYLLGGRRMSPLMIGLSLFATLTSTLSYLAYPGEIIGKGPMILAQLAAYPLIFVVVGWGLIPYIMRQQDVTSGYQLLEARLGVTGRMLGAGIFIALRILWMASIFHATSDTVIAPLLGAEPRWVPWISLAIAAVTLIYTAEGGLRAVVVTDAMQSIIMFLGALAALAAITVELGSVAAWWPTAWAPHWQTPVFGFDPTQRVTFMGAALNMFVWMVCTAGSDQMAIQRYLSTRDAKTARRSFGIQLLTDVSSSAVLTLLGLAVLGYFTLRPTELPAGWTLAGNADDLMPHFIVVGLPAGLTGLVIAALLSAAMSSLSSGMNSSSAVITTDFIARFRRAPLTQAEEVKLARVTSVIVGATAFSVSLIVPHLAENLLDLCIKVVNLFTSPLFALFFLALFVRWATPLGGVAAAVVGSGVAIGMAFFGLFGLSMMWINPVSLVAAVGAGMVASLIPVGSRSRPTI